MNRQNFRFLVGLCAISSFLCWCHPTRTLCRGPYQKKPSHSTRLPFQRFPRSLTIRVFPSPQTVSLTIIGGVQRIAELNPNEIEVVIDFNNWNRQIQFYEPTVNVPFDILEWRDLSPRSLELGVAREVK